MYPPHSLGGYEVMWQSWVRHSRLQGHDVRVLASDFAVADVSASDEPAVRRDLRWYWRDHRFPRYAPWTRLAIEKHNAAIIDRELDGERPDAVVWWSMAGMSFGMVERVRRQGIPSVAVVADYWLEYCLKTDGWMRMFHGRPRLGWAIERLTGLEASINLAETLTPVFASDTVRRSAARIFPPFANAEVAHHEPDAELFVPAPPRPWRWKLLCLGRVVPDKGTDLPIRALTYLPEASLDVIGAGAGSYLDDLKRLVRELGLGQRVTFGERPRAEVASAYEDADVVIFPVRWPEPWGLVPAEAMAVGRPVVASGRGGSGEYCSDGENCLIFDPDAGAAQLAERIQTLARDAELRARLIDGGRETVEALNAVSFAERVQANIHRVAAAGPS